MNLFAGGLHKSRIQQATVGKQEAESNYQETSSQLKMQLVQSVNNLHTAISDYHNAKKQLALAEKYYTDQYKVYKAGQLLVYRITGCTHPTHECQTYSWPLRSPMYRLPMRIPNAMQLLIHSINNKSYATLIILSCSSCCRCHHRHPAPPEQNHSGKKNPIVIPVKVLPVKQYNGLEKIPCVRTVHHR